MRNRAEIICLCTPHSVGGAQNVAARLVLAFRERGYKATLGFLFEVDPSARHGVEDYFVVAKEKPETLAQWVSFLSRCHSEVTRRRPRLIIGFHPLANIIGALFCRFSSGRFVSTQAWPASEQSVVTARLESLLVRTPLVYANIAVSRFVASSFNHWGRSYAGKTSVIYNEPPALPKVNEPVFHMRKTLGISYGALILGCIGRLHPQKNFRLAIKAMAHMSDNVHLYVAGSGVEELMLRDLAKRQGVVDRIHFIGALFGADVTRFYRSVDLLLLTSIYEGHPLVMLEAMSAGTPVIAHNIPVMRETGGEAVIYVSDDPAEWGRVVSSLGEHDRLRLSVLGRGRAAHFAKISMVDEYLKVSGFPPYKMSEI